MILSMVSLLFGAMIYSQEVGNYFDLPSWMTSSVSSKNTPGSDPSTENGGWYLMAGVETTKVERVTLHFQVINQQTYTEYDSQGTETFKYVYPPEDVTSKFNDQHWTNVETNEFYFNGSGIYMGWDKVAQIEKDEEFYSWESGSEGYYPGGRYVVNNIFSAFADNIVTNIESHKVYVPRSPRMTGEIMSGINSTFEGIFERTFEASKGYSNVWELATYGPVAKKLFWFDVPNSDDAVDIYQPMTNRTITSRRFDEYGNINRAATWFTDYFFKGGSRTTIRRPGWICENGYRRLWWASQDDVFPQDFIPPFNWVEDPTETNYWATCLATFGGLESDGIWNVEEYETEEHPGIKIMKPLKWGQPDYDHERCKWNGMTLYGNTNLTMKKVIEDAYPRGDGWAITNRTRRLFFQELSCLNQAVALMDRTYHVPEVTYYGWETNETYRHYATIKGRCDNVELVWSHNGNKYKTKEKELYFSWGALENSHLTTNIVGSGMALCDKIKFQRTTPKNIVAPDFHISTNTESGVLFPPKGNTDFIFEALRRIKLRFPPVYGSRFSMTIIFDGTISPNENFNASIHFDSVFGSANLYSDIEPLTFVDTMDFEADATYSRSYTYDHNDAIPSVGLTQIGVANDTDIGFVLSLHSRDGYTNSIHSSDMPYSVSNSVCSYKTITSPYQNLSEISNVCRTVGNTAKSKFIELNNGRNPSDPTLFIGLQEGTAKAVLGSVKATEVEVSFTRIGGSYYSISGRIIDEDDPPVLDDIRTIVDSGGAWSVVEGVEPTICPAWASLQYEMDDLPEEADVGVTAYGKASAITRKKWNFKTLHRGD